jgi:hypothetical protein
LRKPRLFVGLGGVGADSFFGDLLNLCDYRRLLVIQTIHTSSSFKNKLVLSGQAQANGQFGGVCERVIKGSALLRLLPEFL